MTPTTTPTVTPTPVITTDETFGNIYMKNRMIYSETSGSIDLHVDCNSKTYQFEDQTYTTVELNNIYTLRVVIEHGGQVEVVHTIPGVQSEVYDNIIVLFVYFQDPLFLNDAYIAKIEYTNNSSLKTRTEENSTAYGCVITSLDNNAVTEHTTNLKLNGIIS